VTTEVSELATKGRTGLIDRAKALVRSTPVVGPLVVRCAALVGRLFFPGTARYWEERYAAGHDSGLGSYGELAAFKAEVLNAFVEEHGVRSVIEFGCGDGAQLSLAHYPRYVGMDISRTAMELCRKRFAGDSTKSFHLYVPDAFAEEAARFRADAAFSLDVIYHITEDWLFEAYMSHLFAAAERFVVVYSSDRTDLPRAPHVRHRKFSDWIRDHRPEWRLVRHVTNRYPKTRDGRSGSLADFFFYAKGPG
jgi:methyltransferase family protein